MSVYFCRRGGANGERALDGWALPPATCGRGPWRGRSSASASEEPLADVATARPGVSTAAQGSAAVVRHDGEAGQALSDRTPLLGVLTTRVDQEYGRTGAADLRVQDRAVDGIATDPRRLGVGQRVRVRPKVWLGHSGSVFAGFPVGPFPAGP